MTASRKDINSYLTLRILMFWPDGSEEYHQTLIPVYIHASLAIPMATALFLILFWRDIYGGYA